MANARPSPDALLKRAKAAEQGRLRIFLGAAPGVGKTWEMLTAGRARLRDGVDVVVGVVETHGRAETEALLAGMDILPRRQISRGGIELAEMDLDALLARRPGLALVDELAHSNAVDDLGQGSRHPKRYQDVLELLEAGIDVWTTVNIQHIESLNDVVAGITRIRVRETVPDSIIDRADDIELIDITPDDLLQRLREGKIYLPKTASRALANYFSVGNLTALRELALRRTAQRVDTQLLDHMQAHAIAGPWAAGARVLVCITANGASEALVRRGRQIADLHRAPWIALYVETAASLRLSASVQDRISTCLRLATSLGADTVTLPGHDVVANIIDYARAQNVTEIVIGSPAPRRWWQPWRRSITHDLVDRAGDLPVHVTPLPASRRTPSVPRPPAARPRDYLIAGVMVIAATAVGIVLREVLAVANISLVFLTAVLATATLGGLLPSLLASVLSVLAFNFFFIPPVYSLTIADPENGVALFFFAVVAVIASNLAAAVRAQAVAARQRGLTTEALYGFSRKLAAIASLDDLLWASAYQIAAMLKLRVMLLLPDAHGRITPRAGYPPDDRLEDADIGAAQWCFEHDRATGRSADTLPGARFLFLPLRTSRGVLGVLALDRDEPGPLATPEQQRLLDALADQAAVSIERVMLADDLDQTRRRAETDRLRAALLTSVSHDLRTPLASIRGAAETLQTYGPTLPDSARRDLLASVIEEAERMSRFVANLLDMTRIEAKAVTPRLEAVDVGEAIGSAVARAASVLGTHQVTIDVSKDLPLPLLDPVLFEQVLFNLLDNAAKYAPSTSQIRIAAHDTQAAIEVTVRDHGPGIAAAEIDRIFDPFARASADGRPAGTGLGLAICRGFMTAMGGSITAASRADGAIFTLTLKRPAAAKHPA